MHGGFLYSLLRTMWFSREIFFWLGIFLKNSNQPTDPRNYVPTNVPIFMNPRKLGLTKINDFTASYRDWIIHSTSHFTTYQLYGAVSRCAGMGKKTWMTWCCNPIPQTDGYPLYTARYFPEATLCFVYCGLTSHYNALRSNISSYIYIATEHFHPDSKFFTYFYQAPKLLAARVLLRTKPTSGCQNSLISLRSE